MARFNEILVGRYNRLIQKLLSMKGPAALVSISDEAIAEFPLFSGVENRYLEGWNRFSTSFGIGPVALNASGIRYRNPVGSNVIAVLEKINVNVGAAMSVAQQNGATSADLAALVVPGAARMDPRGNPNSALIFSNQATAPTVPALANGSGQYAIGPPASVSGIDLIITENQEIPLLPGDAIQWVGQTVNTSLNVLVTWRERFLEDSERA